ncbi:MAG TPA: rod shape-determining protein MreC [Acidimicrobiia bacterium]|nr:rod shape-determining protein MreC [Acidimicrobiia bacterium]
MVVYRQDRRRRLTLVLLVITSLVLISLDERGSGLIDSARSAAQDVISPLQRVADSAIDPVADFFDSFGRADELESENARLRDANAKLQAEVDRGQAAASENDRLRSILDIPQISDYDAVAATVESGPVDNFHQTWRIDKGSSQGIAVDMPVVIGGDAGAALVGRVQSVASDSAVIQRIDDRDFGAGAQLVQAGVPGPIGAVRGVANSSLLSFQIANSTDDTTAIGKGDLVVTSGGSASIYPKGLAIGRVTRAVPATTTAVARDTKLAPSVDLDRIDIVKILRPAAPAQ